MAALTLSALNVYPIKSAAGVALESARVDERGLAGDRRWMVVDGSRRFLTQRTHPRLALVSVKIGADGLILNAPGMPALEDGWRRIRIGAIEFHVAQPCIRCTTTTVDQATGERGKEPLATLVTYRRDGNGVLFGQNLVHAGTGELRLGDEVTVLEVV